jgi:hypothetical protein
MLMMLMRATAAAADASVQRYFDDYAGPSTTFLFSRHY